MTSRRKRRDLSGNLRWHNCFILAVDDTMESILDWYREEGLIFKAALAPGVNLSESGQAGNAGVGRTASGPVSFHGAGRTRRRGDQSARRHQRPRNVVLERRPPGMSRSYRDQGRERGEDPGSARWRPSTWTLAARTSPASSTRTPNNSVRVSDRVHAGRRGRSTFDLLARQTGETVRQVQAKDCSPRWPGCLGMC